MKFFIGFLFQDSRFRTRVEQIGFMVEKGVHGLEIVGVLQIKYIKKSSPMKQINYFVSRQIEQKYSFLTIATPDDKNKKPRYVQFVFSILYRNISGRSYRSRKFTLKYFKILLSNLTSVCVSRKIKMYADQ